jgi:hypothetical protein
MATILRYFSLIAIISVSNLCLAQNNIIKLSKASDIQDAKQVQQAMDRVTEKVMICVNKKLAPAQDCHCLYPGEVSNLKEIYNKALDAHPGWKDKVVNFTNDQGNYGYNISFYALHRQFEQKCK